MTIDEIKEAFERLRWAFDSQMTNWALDLYDKCKEEEKGHRSFMPDFARFHEPQTISVSDAARLFAVKRVAEYLKGDEMPMGKDYLHRQKSCFIAAGMVDEFRAEIEKAWTGLDIEALASLNYTDFVKVRQEVEA